MIKKLLISGLILLATGFPGATSASAAENIHQAIIKKADFLLENYDQFEIYLEEFWSEELKDISLPMGIPTDTKTRSFYEMVDIALYMESDSSVHKGYTINFLRSVVTLAQCNKLYGRKDYYAAYENAFTLLTLINLYQTNHRSEFSATNDNIIRQQNSDLETLNKLDINQTQMICQNYKNLFKSQRLENDHLKSIGDTAFIYSQNLLMELSILGH